MSYSLQQSEAYLREQTDLETLNNLIELTKVKKEAIASDNLIDPEIKSIELQRVTAIDNTLIRRKEEHPQHVWDKPLVIDISKK